MIILLRWLYHRYYARKQNNHVAPAENRKDVQ